MLRLLQASAFAALLFVAPFANSGVATWQLHNVTFTDGGTASGFFTLDDDAPGFLGAMEIHTTTVGTFPGNTYTLANVVPPVSNVVHIGQLQITGPTGFLAMTFQETLFTQQVDVLVPTPGQLVDFDLTNPQNYEYLYNSTFALRNIVSGSLIAIPQPDVSVFLGIGLAVLLLAGRLSRRGGRVTLPRRERMLASAS